MMDRMKDRIVERGGNGQINGSMEGQMNGNDMRFFTVLWNKTAVTDG